MLSGLIIGISGIFIFFRASRTSGAMIFVGGFGLLAQQVLMTFFYPGSWSENMSESEQLDLLELVNKFAYAMKLIPQVAVVFLAIGLFVLSAQLKGYNKRL